MDAKGLDIDQVNEEEKQRILARKSNSQHGNGAGRNGGGQRVSGDRGYQGRGGYGSGGGRGRNVGTGGGRGRKDNAKQPAESHYASVKCTGC